MPSDTEMIDKETNASSRTTAVDEDDVDDDVVAVKVDVDDDLTMTQLIFNHSRKTTIDGDDDDLGKAAIIEALKTRNMAEKYVELCAQFSWEVDAEAVRGMRRSNEETLKAIDAKISDAIENLGDVEVRDGLWERSVFYASIGSSSKAVEGFLETEGKTASVGQKMDGVFATIRLRFSRLELGEVKTLIERIKEMLDQPGGGDWERKNRLKVYEGLYCAATRDFAKATTLFLDSLSTFTTYELLTYEDFVFYTVVCAIVSLPRTELKAKVIDSPEVLSVLNRLPGVGDFLNALHKCDYKTFMSAFPTIADQVENSVWLNPHYRYFLREVRVVAYAQYLQSYKSVTVKSMAESFSVSEDFIDRELSQFIVAGRLNCKIDKVAGVLQTNRPDVKNALYQSLIKDGDVLLNRVQKLSRVIDV